MRFLSALCLLAAIFATPAEAHAPPARAHAARHYHHQHAWRHRHYRHVRHFHRHVTLTPAPAADPNPFGALFAPIFRPQIVWSGTVADKVARSAAAHGVPQDLALAVAKFESGFNPRKVGSSGERGAMQVLPATAHHVGVYGDLSGANGIEAGMRYLKQALEIQGRYGMCAAVSAYNHGIGRIYCSHYGRTVLALMMHQPWLRAAHR